MSNVNEQSDQTARFKVLSDPSRIKILQFLKDEPQTVGVIVEAMGIERTLVSHHLKILREHQMVVADKSGRNIFYRVHDDLLATVRENSFNFGCCEISFPESADGI